MLPNQLRASSVTELNTILGENAQTEGKATHSWTTGLMIGIEAARRIGELLDTLGMEKCVKVQWFRGVVGRISASLANMAG
jgi:hypothetical protein